MQASSIKMQAYNMKMVMIVGADLVEEAIDLVEKYQNFTTKKDKLAIDDTSKST